MVPVNTNNAVFETLPWSRSIIAGAPKNMMATTDTIPVGSIEWRNDTATITMFTSHAMVLPHHAIHVFFINRYIWKVRETIATVIRAI